MGSFSPLVHLISIRITRHFTAYPTPMCATLSYLLSRNFPKIYMYVYSVCILKLLWMNMCVAACRRLPVPHYPLLITDEGKRYYKSMRHFCRTASKFINDWSQIICLVVIRQSLCAFFRFSYLVSCLNQINLYFVFDGIVVLMLKFSQFSKFTMIIKFLYAALCLITFFN